MASLSGNNSFQSPSAEPELTVGQRLRDLRTERSWSQRELARQAGLRLPQTPTVFEGLMWALVGQQVNLAFAYRLRRALVEPRRRPDRGEARRGWRKRAWPNLLGADRVCLRRDRDCGAPPLFFFSRRG